MSVVKKCPICKNLFKVFPSRPQITCSLICRSKRWKNKGTFKAENNPFWKGGKAKYSDGYIIIKSLEHPHKDKNGYVREHRLVMESEIGRYLLPTEHVHHINGNKEDNRIENLMLFESNSAHEKYHHPKGVQVANPRN